MQKGELASQLEAKTCYAVKKGTVREGGVRKVRTLGSQEWRKHGGLEAGRTGHEHGGCPRVQRAWKPRAGAWT